MDKLQFTFKLLEATEKTNLLCITEITTPDNRTYIIPNEWKPAYKHKEISETSAFNKVKNALKKRGQYRKIWIPLTKDLKKIYLDEGENLQFADEYLEELTQQLDETGKKHIENENTPGKVENLKKVAEKFILEKFSNKANANQWIEEFEKECDRFEIDKDERKIEMLRNLLEKSHLEWYSSMIIKFSINSEWSEWKKKFCETYGNKGWSQVKYAFNFKYQAGPLIEYATRKERLLLDVNKNIDESTIINLIAVGLPEDILHKIDREAIKQTTQLFAEINKYEHLQKKIEVEKKLKTKSDYKEFGQRKPCTICEKLGKGSRFHPESKCFFKKSENNSKNNKVINNLTIDAELIEEPKNEQ